MVRKLIKKHNLPYLCIKMAHMRFSNLGEMLQADLQSKLMQGISDREYESRKCNCNAVNKVDGKCLFDGKCREAMIVYEIKDKITGKSYIGKTQRYLKKRTAEHIGDVVAIILNKPNASTRADAFAKHFVTYCQDCTTSNQVRARLKPLIQPSIIWQGDRIQCMKSSRTRECTICMVERKQIISSLRKDKYKVINDNSDIYSPCKCSSKFHKFKHNSTMALRTRLTQNEVTPNKRSKKKRRRSRGFVTPKTNSSPITPDSESLFPESISNVGPNMRQDMWKWGISAASNLDFESEVTFC